MELFPKKQELESYNNRMGTSVRQFFLPSSAQIFFYVLISSLSLVLINAPGIWKKFSTDYLSQTSFSDVINQSSPFLIQVVNKLQHSRIPQIIFWALVGCSLYLIIWFIANVISNVRNDIIADAYLHPTGYSRKNYWESVIARKIFLICSFIVLIAYLFAAFKLAGAIAKFFLAAVVDFRWHPSLEKILLSVIVIALLLYILILLTHLIYNLWRLVYSNF